MIIPLSLNCSECGSKCAVEIQLKGKIPPFKCKCGYVNTGFLGNSVTVGVQIWFRAHHELWEKKDFALSIVLSAMALDCDLARLHHKWTSIQHLEKNRVDISDEDLDASLRKLNAIDQKIEHVSGLLFPGGMEAYIKSVPEIDAQIQKAFPSLRQPPIAKAIQKSLFYPRNAILHLGKAARTHEEALRCSNVAMLGMHILNQMDNVRRKVV